MQLGVIYSCCLIGIPIIQNTWQLELVPFILLNAACLAVFNTLNVILFMKARNTALKEHPKTFYDYFDTGGHGETQLATLFKVPKGYYGEKADRYIKQVRILTVMVVLNVVLMLLELYFLVLA